MIVTSPLNSVCNENKTSHTHKKVPDTTVAGILMKLVKECTFLHIGILSLNNSFLNENENNFIRTEKKSNIIVVLKLECTFQHTGVVVADCRRNATCRRQQMSRDSRATCIRGRRVSACALSVRESVSRAYFPRAFQERLLIVVAGALLGSRIRDCLFYGAGLSPPGEKLRYTD